MFVFVVCPRIRVIGQRTDSKYLPLLNAAFSFSSSLFLFVFPFFFTFIISIYLPSCLFFFRLSHSLFSLFTHLCCSLKFFFFSFRSPSVHIFFFIYVLLVCYIFRKHVTRFFAPAITRCGRGKVHI
ncbi:hypothetical protein, unlikely [Trypanosoma brucei gambiense DAL972]|uniref:Uncharacterized protein n=1 Tax=Trypanosoma brucei gambiense (strain MHOM/CI/86/DAL972) TaxID=679716 RepID=D0A2N8_TRYB9|nr:hypothetical protein, unlikely [Trypanosoma brucei gambiense DAL972]CBH15532.1 hypothetical protein, unlikely [Trypanosoma brucei gambiense DAL972]|eukprot:XP_011777796.1 hypothetical protein, unlikely [Trypanosoma brucei gambiense DAL972]